METMNPITKSKSKNNKIKIIKKINQLIKTNLIKEKVFKEKGKKALKMTKKEAYLVIPATDRPNRRSDLVVETSGVSDILEYF